MSSGATDWLRQLAPAHAPAPASWWPLAPGWWGVMLLGVGLVAALVYWQTRPSLRRRRLALRELDRLAARTGDERALAQALEDLVRRYAVARYGREPVARLCGERWLEFVVAHGGERWRGAVGGHLLRAAYGGSPQGERDAWIDGARGFIKARR